MNGLVFFDGSGADAFGQSWAGGRRLVACWKRGRLMAHILDVATLETHKVPLALFDARSEPVEDRHRVRLAIVAKAIRDRCKCLDDCAMTRHHENGGQGAKTAALPRRAIKATLAGLKG